MTEYKNYAPQPRREVGSKMSSVSQSVPDEDLRCSEKKAQKFDNIRFAWQKNANKMQSGINGRGCLIELALAYLFASTQVNVVQECVTGVLHFY